MEKNNQCVKITNSLVGNGGLSFRKRSAILKILKLVDYKFKSNSKMSEDIFYSMWMKKFNMNVPTEMEAELFSSEHICNFDCAGLHKVYNYLSKKVKKLINIYIFNPFFIFKYPIFIIILKHLHHILEINNIYILLVYKQYNSQMYLFVMVLLNLFDNNVVIYNDKNHYLVLSLRMLSIQHNPFD